MQDIKVIETINKWIQEDKNIGFPPIYHPLAFFAEAVALTRQGPGVSIENIAKCFKAQFDDEELKALINNLT
jgi:hypothetical protein